MQILNGHSYYVYCIALISENKIASGSEDNTVKIWNVDNGNCLNTIEGHPQLVYCILKTKENELVSGCDDN